MEAATVPWRPIGELFVHNGLISQEQLEEALAEQAATGLRLGEILVKRNLISSPELTQVLMEQLGREVAKEEGFGTGLWSEIRRRSARPGTEPTPVPLDSDRTPFGDGLKQKIGGTEEPSSPADHRNELRAVPAESLPGETDETEVEVLGAALQEARLEIEALRQDVAEREHSLAELTEEMGCLERVGDGAGGGADDTAALKQELAAAERELYVRAARLDELETTLATYEGRIAELQEKLTEAESRAREQSQVQTAGVEQELATVRDRVAELEAEISDANGRAFELESTLAAERDAHSETRQRADDAARSNERARQALEEVERGLTAAQAERDAVREAAAAASDGFAAHQHELAAVREQLAAAEAALDTERTAHDGTRHALDELNARIDAARTEHEQSLAELHTTLDTLRSEQDAARSESSATREFLEQRELEFAAVREQLAAAETALANEEAERRRTLDSLAEATARAMELQQARDDLAERERGLVAELAAGQEARSGLKDELSATRNRLESALEDERRACEGARRDADGLTAKLLDSEQRVAELAARLERAAEEQEALSTALVDQRQAFERELGVLGARLADESAVHSETRSVRAQTLADLAGRESTPAVDQHQLTPQDYLCFVPASDGYRLVARHGVPPAPGDRCTVDDVAHVIMRVGRSPLPFDSRLCAYLLAAD